MQDDAPGLDPAITRTVEIVTAYAAHNSLPASELAGLIATVHASVVGMAAPAGTTEPAVEKPTSAQVRKSITPEGLISFLDGRPYKTLKRHLTRHDLTPEAYRARYGLPRDYPMTAPAYSEARSALARRLGLGQGRRAAAPEPAAQPEPEPAKPKRERRKAGADA